MLTFKPKRHTFVRNSRELLYKNELLFRATFSQIPRPLGEPGFLSLGEAIRPAVELNFLKRWGAFFT